MAYRAKALTLALAVTRSINRLDLNPNSHVAGRFFSMECCYGTKAQRRLAYVEWAESTQDSREAFRTKLALQRYGSVRAAVMQEGY